MQQDDSRDAEASPAKPAEAAPALSRRRLLRSGLKATPIVLTLASRPVLATTCVTASISVSAGSRGTGPVWASCSGWNPTTWCGKPSYQWPTGCWGKKFSDVFTRYSYDVNATILMVMNGTAAHSETADNQLLAKNACAAWLNYQSGKTDPAMFTLDTIKKTWNDGRSSAFVVAGSTTTWGPTKLNPWLSNMFS